MTRKVSDELARRFGFRPDLLRRFAMVEHDDDVFITTPEADDFDTFKPVRKGIRLARLFNHGVKPTTNAMQLLGRHATRNTVTIDALQAARFIQGGLIEIEAGVEPGFVVVLHDGFCLGVGLYKPGLLRSQVPVSRRTHG